MCECDIEIHSPEQILVENKNRKLRHECSLYLQFGSIHAELHLIGTYLDCKFMRYGRMNRTNVVFARLNCLSVVVVMAFVSHCRVLAKKSKLFMKINSTTCKVHVHIQIQKIIRKNVI